MIKSFGNKTKVAVFISGRGTNFKSLFYFSKKKKSKVQICIVISNKKYAKGLDFAKKHNIKFQIYTFKNSLRDEYLKDIDADMCLVIAYGQIIPESFLNLTKKGFINIHASLLPKYRGAAPIQRAIMNLEKKTGISIMKINSQLDEGPVCKSYEIDIDEKDSSDDLSEKLSDLAVEKILDDIDDILDDKAKFRDQDHSNATYAKKIDKKESIIDWNTPAKSVIAKINGLNGAHFIFQGARYKILKAELNNLSGKPGEIIGDSLEIACKEKSIKVMMIQREGKKPQKTPEFLLGSQIKKGLFLSNV